tara:strand:+ start:1159 stop:1449 length:291 start_codon:yes stop_codon:yes gene_type:complete
MELWKFDPPSVANCFLIFFSVSFAILGLICCAGLPVLISAIRMHARHFMLRRRRSGRMLADPVKLMRDSRALEGVYRFEMPVSDETGDDDYSVSAA